jgi:hypothetical protein
MDTPGSLQPLESMDLPLPADCLVDQAEPMIPIRRCLSVEALDSHSNPVRWLGLALQDKRGDETHDLPQDVG